MTVEEVKAKLPLAEIYEFKPDCRYVVICDPAKVDHKQIENLVLDEGDENSFDLPPMVFLFTRDGGGLQIFELEKHA